MVGRDALYKLKDKIEDYLPNILHATGAVISIASGIPSIPHNPGYAFNVGVSGLLGYETIPSRTPKNYLPSSKYDGLAGASRGYTSSRNVKALFGGALTAMSVWFGLQGNFHAALENSLFDLGLMLSVAGSEIERRRVLRELKELEKKL
jgi:hypothetical protein